MNLFSLDPYLAATACRDGGRGRIVILSGGRGAGKTSWCLALANIARELGLAVAGLVSPAVFREGRKIAIDLRDLRDNETRRLAERPAPGTPGTAGLGWRFETSTLAWGNRIVESAGACDLLMIDELGPLEFRDDAGLNEAFAAVDAGEYRLAVLVVRPELVPEASRRWPEAQVVRPLG